MGGVGKTQLAVRFALNHEADYRVVWRVQADNESTTTLDLSNLAVALELADEGEDVNQKLVKLQYWFTKNDDWLLIFDNAQNLDVLKVAFPSGGAILGKVVITSVKEDWGNSVDEIPLGVWAEAEAVAFLENRLNKGKYRSRDELVELAKELGSLPLALEQAAAYVSSTPTTLREYIHLFQTRRRELWIDKKHEQPPSDYHATVATTWSISLETIEKAFPGALAMLQVCALFAPYDIPLSLLEWDKDMLPDPLPTILEDPLTRNQAIATLRDYSLISLTQLSSGDAFIGVHNLVQDVVRDGMPDYDTFLEAVLKLQIAAFPFEKEKQETWQTSDLLSQHMLVSARLAKDTNVDKMLMTTAINNAANFLAIKGQFLGSDNLHQEAEALYEEILKTREDHFRDQPGSIAVVLSGLAEVKRVRVQESAKRFLSTYERTFQNTADDIAEFVEEMDRVEKSLEDVLVLYERARALDEEQFGSNSERYAYRISRLGFAYVDLVTSTGREGLLEEAEKLQLEALGTVETKVEDGELSEENLIDYLKNLARTQLLLAKPSDAKRTLLRLKSLVEKHLPPVCLTAASVQESLGYVALSPHVNRVERWAAPKYFGKARDLYKELGYEEKYFLNVFNFVNGLLACNRNGAEWHMRYVPPHLVKSFMEHFMLHTKGVPVGLLREVKEAVKDLVTAKRQEERKNTSEKK